MESSSSSNATVNHHDPAHDNTTTFIVGFGVLLIFVLLGILASAFLCFTLKKDPYLWEAERERQLQEKDNETLEECTKDRTKVAIKSDDEGIGV